MDVSKVPGGRIKPAELPAEPTVTYSAVEKAFQGIAAKHKNLGIDKIIDDLFGRRDSPTEESQEMKGQYDG